MTALIVAVNVLVFVLLSLTGGADDSNLYRWGAKFGPAIQDGDWYRLIAPVFLHAGLLHIAANTFALIIFGPRLEQEFGSLAFVATYIVAGVCGVAASYLVSPDLMSVGASGAVFGMVGAYGVYLVRNRREFGGQVNSVILNLIFIIVINIVFGLVWPGIDQGAHVGGLIAGAAMAFVVSPRKVIEIEDDFMLFGAPIVRTRFARATRSNILLAAAAGLLVAIVISWWVTNDVVYDASTIDRYLEFESATN